MTIMRGTKSRLYPNRAQAVTMDLWRRRTRELWNLLLNLEQAAYSGDNMRSQLGWRSIWAQVLEESYTASLRSWEAGKKARMGKNKGQTIPPRTGPEPQPPEPTMLAKINRQVREIDPETGESMSARLFIWEHELQKIMARLKQVPRTEWIADLPSHAAQAVVKDLVKALKAMLRERKKRTSGAGGRDTGFPKFKKNRYAAGSVYFANTQIKIERKRGAEERVTPKGPSFARVRFPNGVGWVECRLDRRIAEALDAKRATLMGGRIWRQGEDWYLSCQWKLDKPQPMPETGRTAAVKIAAAIPITVYDDRGQTKEYELPPIDKEVLSAHAAAGRAQSRCLEARKKRTKKREAYYRKRHAQKLERGLPVKRDPGRARIPLPSGFYAAAARLAKIEGQDRDMRDNWMHQITTAIVKRFDVIAVQRMEVARMMKKPKAVEEGDETEIKRDQGKRRSLKAARVMMRRTAMARIQQVLKYKAIDMRGEASYEELDALYPTVQPCSRCGVIHPEMKDGKQVMRCAEQMPDGSTCGNRLARNRNAARIVARELANRLKQRERHA